MKLHSKTRMLDLKNRIAVVAIINATPDSYFDGGKYTTPDTVMVMPPTEINGNCHPV
jgi:dihydropteroate synthase